MIFLLKMAAQLEEGQANRAISAILMMLMLLRLVKTAQYHPKLYFITRTIELATAQLLPFLVNATIFESCIFLQSVHLQSAVLVL